MIMKSSLARKSLDNITCVLIAFENFETHWLNNKPGSLSPRSSFHVYSALDNKEEDIYLKSEPDKVIPKKKLDKLLISPKSNMTSKNY
jgi:hypothetical protein